jgi:hypothetical protein
MIIIEKTRVVYDYHRKRRLDSPGGRAHDQSLGVCFVPEVQDAFGYVSCGVHRYSRVVTS